MYSISFPLLDIIASVQIENLTRSISNQNDKVYSLLLYNICDGIWKTYLLGTSKLL